MSHPERFFKLILLKAAPNSKMPEEMKIPIPGYPALVFRHGLFSTTSHLLAEGLKNGPIAPVSDDAEYTDHMNRKVTVPGAPPFHINEMTKEEFEEAKSRFEPAQETEGSEQEEVLEPVGVSVSADLGEGELDGSSDADGSENPQRDQGHVEGLQDNASD